MGSWWVRARQLPGVGTDVVIPQIPVIRTTFQPVLNGIGNGSIDVPASYVRKDAIKGTLLEVFQNGQPVYQFFADFVGDPYSEADVELINISGNGIEDSASWPILYPKDYPLQPTVDPDWAYGANDPIGTFRNSDFDADSISTGWENQAAGGWTEINTALAGFNSVDDDIEIDDTNPRSGSYCMTFQPGAGRSGVEKQTIEVIPGGRYQITIYVADLTAGGGRVTFGASVEEGFAAFHSNRFEFNGYSMCELGNVPQGSGSLDGTYQALTLDIQMGEEQTETTLQLVWEDALAGPLLYVDDFLFTGVGSGIEPWQALAKGTAVVNVFEKSAAESLSAPYSLSFQGVSGTAAATMGVEQEFTGAEDGTVMTFQAWFKCAVPVDLRLIIARGNNGGWISDVPISIPAGIWTRGQVSANLSATDGIVSVQARYDGLGASPLIFMDNAIPFAGAPANTVGAIAIAMMDDATINHVATGPPGLPREILEWLDYSSFSATHSSGGTPWQDDEIGVVLQRGMRYSQAFGEFIIRNGYEWRIVWDDPAQRFELQIFNPLELGTDYSVPKLPALYEGKALIGGSIEGYVPERNHVLAEGALGLWTEAQDVPDQTSYGRREYYTGDDRIPDEATLGILADAQLALFTPELGLSLTMTWDDSILPLVDFQVGDTIWVEIPSRGIEAAYRVRSIQATLSSISDTQFQIGLNALITEQAAAAEIAILALLNRFTGLGSPGGGAGTAIAGGSGVGPPIEVSYLVAAFDARQAIRDRADYICSGANDQREILAAMADASPNGRVMMSDGSFNVTSSPAFTIPAGVELNGVGAPATTIYVMSSGMTITVATGGALRRVALVDDTGC